MVAHGRWVEAWDGNVDGVRPERLRVSQAPDIAGVLGFERDALAVAKDAVEAALVDHSKPPWSTMPDGLMGMTITATHGVVE